MSLHYALYTRNLTSFRAILDGGTSPNTANNGGSPRSKSFKGGSVLKSAMTAPDVNAFDWLGRSVLHIACAATDALEYVRAVLKHPFVNVNLPDREGHWTPLHRALYNGNIGAALLLLQRSDIDTSLKDLEGHTPFDLYNTTVNGTAPTTSTFGELHTWGVNRNAALGLGDSGDRTQPDLVIVPKEGSGPTSTKRFLPLRTRQIQMAKLHTVVVTSERKANMRVCGFGSGGRLGPGQHTQYRLVPVPMPPSTEVTAVALGQDHTLALTSTGEVYSWGLSRFHQLGYVVEPSPTMGKLEEPIQATPRRIYGPLKKEIVKGIAASKQSSVCWTATEVFSWGTNNGQLGYDKAAQPYQILPRKVSKIVRPVMAIALNDNAMACLLDNQEVFCLWNDRYIKINFPTQAFPSEIQPYRPPQAMKFMDAHIAKITSSEDTFAALSSNGELFTFSTPDPNEAGQLSKPQRVWALRKQFSAVRDVAVGADGTIIICTESGHVFVRSRNSKNSQGSSSNAPTKAFKFQRVPYIQRVTQVCANSTGAFGALRVDFRPQPIRIEGNTISEDLAAIQPYLASPVPSFLLDENAPPVENPPSTFLAEDGEEAEDAAIEADIAGVWRLCRILHNGAVKPARYGANVMVHVGGKEFPAHRLFLAARSEPIRAVFGGKQLRDGNVSVKMTSATRLDVKGCAPITVLILLQYIYSDNLLAIWDRRVFSTLNAELSALKVKPAQVKLELQQFARMLEMPLLAQALEAPTKRVPESSLNRDLEQLYRFAQDNPNIRSPISPDVVLQLADRDVHCHSAILRARSPIFSSFFDEPDWTARRRDANGVVKINLKHLKWDVMEYVLGYLCYGAEGDMFDTLSFAKTVDDIIEFMFEVIAAATELLLDRLVLLCSEVILRWVDINNACYIVSDASHFHARQLVESVQGYLAANMETLLESQMLSDLTPTLIKQLSAFVAKKQAEKSPKTRTGFIINRAMRAYGEWLALQDIPEPIAPSSRLPGRKVPLSPDSQPKRKPSFPSSPFIAPQASSTAIDDIFEIDVGEVDVSVAHTPKSAPVWKAASVPRADMKVLMAEAAQSSPRTQPKPVVHPKSADAPSFSRATGTPWKVAGAAAHSPPINTPPKKTSQEAFPTLGAGPSTPPRPRGPQPPTPSLGPVFTPTRQTAPASRPSPSNTRRVSSNNKAWTQTPPTSASTTSGSSGASFIAIQQLQLEQEQDVSAKKGKKSLADIQAEEQFLKWWAEEEARVKAEEEANAAAIARLTAQNTKAPRRPRKHKNPQRQPGPGPMLSSHAA
ncbi:hypothetical protein MKEN_01038600 [Mycena kentingensis (nom. inval.)]|nr:hypothetical protein MKEN_01038600 [Mycena kentingensis (nom. inval.)]